MFRLPYKNIEKGTVFSIETLKSSDIFIARENGERYGWSNDTLRSAGWTQYSEDYLDSMSSITATLFNKKGCCVPMTPTIFSLELWHCKVQQKAVTTLPQVMTEETVAAIFVIEGMKLRAI